MHHQFLIPSLNFPTPFVPIGPFLLPGSPLRCTSGLSRTIVDPGRLEIALRKTTMKPLVIGMLHVKCRIILRSDNMMVDIVEIMAMLRAEIEK